MNDKILEKLIRTEEKRQAATINLIASENYVSPEIRRVLGSVLTNKYSEGYPGKRYYSGNEIYDKIELLAIERLKKLFKLNNDWHVNVQPYSGSSANLAIYFSLLRPGETIMGMSLPAGGHLTHGHKVNFSGLYYKSVQYGVDPETGLINYKDVEKMAAEQQPRIIISGASSYPRKIDFSEFGRISKKVSAYYVADISHIAGLVVAGVHPSPFADADVVMTTTHKTLRGPRSAVIFCKKDLADRIDRAVFPGLQGGPHNQEIAAKALMAFEANHSSFRNYGKQIIKNAKKLAEALMARNFTLVTGGTDNHIILLDCKGFGSDGHKSQNLLEEAGIMTNRNALVGDASPFYPTGLRLGTPAVTTQGMKEAEMGKIADWFERVLIKKEKPSKIKKEIELLCKKWTAD
ncbi:MAG: serine hydroxymethyltransferase [Patescibacteria group bacterium]